MKLHTSKPPTTFPGRPETPREDLPATAEPGKPIAMGDSLAAKARRLKKQREAE
jgi:hypothetical protein